MNVEMLVRTSLGRISGLFF